MKQITFLLLVLTSLEATAQIHHFGFKGGVSWVNVNSELSEFIEGTQRFNGGLTYEYQFENNFVLGADFIYAQKGYTDVAYFAEPNRPTVKADIAWHFNYLSLPIKGGYKLGNKFSALINIGIVPSFLASAKVTVPPIDGISTGEPIDISELAAKFDFAGTIEIGCNYSTGERIQFCALIAYQHSFTNINNSESLMYGVMKYREIIASLGVKYKLTRN